ncbi:hypothetical protein ACFFRR_001465 [Megaselia abdita]
MVREVMKFDPNYAVVKIIREDKIQRGRRQDYGIFPTEWVPKGCPYWGQILEWFGNRREYLTHYLYSKYDNAIINFVQYRDGRVKVTRNYVNAVIKEKKDKGSDWKETPYIHKDPEMVHRYVYPTEYIPKDSSYYTELLQDVFFPRDGVKWIHTYGRDGALVHFRLGLAGESLVVHRNGVTVELYRA